MIRIKPAKSSIRKITLQEHEKIFGHSSLLKRNKFLLNRDFLLQNQDPQGNGL